MDAGDALDQGALAGTVVADQGGDLAGSDVEIDAAQHVHGSEALLDTPQAEQRLIRRRYGCLLGGWDGHRDLLRRWIDGSAADHGPRECGKGLGGPSRQERAPELEAGVT
ncbi:hypothetical protein GCM10023350_40720 [Nocardioides endophyticus]|uniref:Uncharacterized protein n=1 Tax=Nocardioides endophyticus TaxID=1353775 RepID=A0ABP8ZBQ1_9ACTN